MSDKKLKDIPQLKVLFEDVCPQGTVDKVVDNLIQNHSYRLEKLGHYLPGPGTGMYVELAEIMSVVIDMKEELNLGENPLLYVYLACEIVRRMRSAYGYSSDIEIKGIPLSASPSGPFPPIPKTPISGELIRMGFTQESIDNIVKQYYQDYPEWWYIKAEAARIGMVPYYGRPFNTKQYFTRLLPPDFSYDENNIYFIASAIDADVSRRIQEFCNIPNFS